MSMKISNQDRRRLELLLTLCENLDDLKKRLVWSEQDPSLDDSTDETLTEFIRVIGIVSRWLSPDFRDETRSQIMWGCVAMLRRNYSSFDDRRGSKADWEIAQTDVHTLIDLCRWWLTTGETAPMPCNVRAEAKGGRKWR